MPYFFSHPEKTYMTMPVLTPYLGPILNYPDTDKQTSIYSFEKKVLSQLIEQLPSHRYFEMKAHPSCSYGLPFHWNQYALAHRFTYKIELNTSLETIFSSFKSEVRGKIRKAENAVITAYSDEMSEFLELNKRTFLRQNMELPYAEHTIQDLDNVLQNLQARKILLAKDKEGNVHSSLYLVYDHDTMYVLMAGEDPEFRSSGAGSLLIYTAIELAMQMKLKWFDFCGSNIKNIETNRRAYGAQQVPYLFITKTSGRLQRMKRALAYLIRG